MFAVLVFMLVIVAIALGVVALVALPQIRSGEQVFSDDGRQAVARAGQRAREGTGAVTDGTRNLIQSARSGLPGGPRPSPAESGPIPEVSVPVDAQAGPDLVIDLREPRDGPAAQEAAGHGRSGHPG